MPGNSLGEETDSSCPQKAYNLVRKKKKKNRENAIIPEIWYYGVFFAVYTSLYRHNLPILAANLFGKENGAAMIPTFHVRKQRGIE